MYKLGPSQLLYIFVAFGDGGGGGGGSSRVPLAPDISYLAARRLLFLRSIVFVPSAFVSCNSYIIGSNGGVLRNNIVVFGSDRLHALDGTVFLANWFLLSEFVDLVVGALLACNLVVFLGFIIDGDLDFGLAALRGIGYIL